MEVDLCGSAPDKQRGSCSYSLVSRTQPPRYCASFGKHTNLNDCILNLRHSWSCVSSQWENTHNECAVPGTTYGVSWWRTRDLLCAFLPANHHRRRHGNRRYPRESKYPKVAASTKDSSCFILPLPIINSSAEAEAKQKSVQASCFEQVCLLAPPPPLVPFHTWTICMKKNGERKGEWNETNLIWEVSFWKKFVCSLCLSLLCCNGHEHVSCTQNNCNKEEEE